VAEALSAAGWVTLASAGPAGIQASRLACEARGERLYALLPVTSDQLFNLEHTPEVALVGETWQARGPARILTAAERPPGLFAAQPPDAHNDVVVEVCPARFTFLHPSGWGADETIEL
jgi:hypothetical protein